MVKKQIKICTLCLALLFSGAVSVKSADSRITLPSGKKIFVSGMNLAWIQYAGDVGNTDLRATDVSNAMKAISDSGANTMRIWLSTDGTNDPKYGSDGLVTGPGTKTIANIQKMLQLAKTHNILVMPVLLTHNWVKKDINSTILANNKKMLKTEAGLQAYIDNYLKPVVTAIGNDPNLICWEVYNEPEGMVQGWSSPANTITEAEVKRSVNWIASAIRQTVPNVLVSNGAASLGTVNWYTDAALKAAGGKADGTLDFYMAHYYGWNGTSNSPFVKSCAAWNFDKPLVIGEYASSDWSSSTPSSNPMQDAGAKVDTLMTYLNKAGYAGGLGWQYQQDGGDPWMKGFSTFGRSMALAYRADSNSIKLTGTGSNTFVVIASAGNGGKVIVSAVGRLESGKSDTLKATANEGYEFTGWTGDTTSTDPTLIIKSVTKDWSVQANFVAGAGTNLIKGGDMSDETAWGFYAATGNTAKLVFTEGYAAVEITKADTLNYGIQLTQGDIALDSGTAYLITFDAWSTGERPLAIGLSTAGTWHYQGGGAASLIATIKSFSVEITPDSSTTAGILQFNAGGSTLPVHVDNVQMVKKSSSAVRHFNTLKNSQMVSFKRVGDRIFWSSQSSLSKVSLVDINGRVIRPASICSPINMHGVSAGMYLVVVNDGIKRQTFRIMK